MNSLVQGFRFICRYFTRSTLFVVIIAVSSGINLLFTAFQLRHSSTREFADYSVTVSAIVLQSGVMSGLSVEVTRLLSTPETNTLKHPERIFLLNYNSLKSIVVFLLVFFPTFIVAKSLLNLKTFDALVIPAFLIPSFYQAIYIGKLQARTRVITYALIGASTPAFMISLAVFKVRFLSDLHYWSWIYLLAASVTTVLAKISSKDVMLNISTVFNWNLVKTSGFVFLTYWVLRIDILTARAALGGISGDKYITVSALATTIVGFSTLVGLFSIKSVTTSDQQLRKILIRRLLSFLATLWFAVLISIALLGPTIFEYILKDQFFVERSEYIPIFLAVSPYGIAIPLAFSVIAVYRTTLTYLFLITAISLTISLPILSLDTMGYCIVYGVSGLILLGALIKTTLSSR